MRLTSAQLDTVILKCRKCRQKKKALWFKLAENPKDIYTAQTICSDCSNKRRHKPEPEPEPPVEPWTPSKIFPMHRMYKGQRDPDSGDSRWCEHALKFRYKKYVKKHTQINKEFAHLARKNLDIDDPADTIKCMAEIEKYRSKHE